MIFGKHLVRQALLAALLALPACAAAEVSAAFDPGTGNIIVSGLSEQERALARTERKHVRVTVEGSQSSRGMAINLSDQNRSLVVSPRFLLRAGTTYVVSLMFDGREFRELVPIPRATATVPSVVAFAPSQSVIPANTLRIYVHFSEPMARGHLLKSIALFREDGSQVPSPFLNLETELWDSTHTRATLLFDPGRIKLGVGPNNDVGARLEPGEAYRLIIQDGMKSAAGIALNDNTQLSFRAGPSERRAISPDAWDMTIPAAGSTTAFSVSFDRIMDSGVVRRKLTMQDPLGRGVQGEIHTDGGGWSLSPAQPWLEGVYALVVAPELEDVSGNTLGAPFDATLGTIGAHDTAEVIPLQIQTPIN